GGRKSTSAFDWEPRSPPQGRELTGCSSRAQSRLCRSGPPQRTPTRRSTKPSGCQRCEGPQREPPRGRCERDRRTIGSRCCYRGSRLRRHHDHHTQEHERGRQTYKVVVPVPHNDGLPVDDAPWHYEVRGALCVIKVLELRR